MEEKNTKAPEITLELIKAEYPDIVKALNEAGATAENQRIKDVRMQLVPGHEALVESMAFDGKSTGADAALAIVAAEKVIRASAAESFKKDAPEIVPVVNNDNPTNHTEDERLISIVSVLIVGPHRQFSVLLPDPAEHLAQKACCPPSVARSLSFSACKRCHGRGR